MRQIHFSLGHFPAGKLDREKNGPKIFMMISNKNPQGPQEHIVSDSEEGWRELEDEILDQLRMFREKSHE